MSRTKRGYLSRRRRTKNRSFTKGFQGSHARLNRVILQQKIRALSSSYGDRDRQKRQFRRLWITRINAGIRENINMVSSTYSRLINNLYKRQLLVNRKILAQITILNRNCLYIISDDTLK